MKPPTLFGIMVARLIPVLIGSGMLCACGDDLTISAASYAAATDTTRSSSSGTATPTTPAGGSSNVGLNVLVSGLDSGESLHFSVNGSTVGSGVIAANGDTAVPGNVTDLMVGSTYSFAITVQPLDEFCAAANASGTIGSTIPPNITITCGARASSPSVIAAAESSPAGIKSSASHPTPQARQGAAAWTDPNGRLWMFGGNGYDAEGASKTFGDLWRLSPESSGWSLLPASSEAPAARAYATSWTDANGDLWLFGGQGRDMSGTAYVLNDLWKFSVSSGRWTRVSGSARKNMPGVYGLAGVSAADNVPGGRSNAVTWTDSAGMLWLFGGYGMDSTGALGTLDDLWQFVPATDSWTWVSGSVTAVGA